MNTVNNEPYKNIREYCWKRAEEKRKRERKKKRRKKRDTGCYLQMMKGLLYLCIKPLPMHNSNFISLRQCFLCYPIPLEFIIFVLVVILKIIILHQMSLSILSLSQRITKHCRHSFMLYLSAD